MTEITGELCHFCSEKKLTLREDTLDIPYFGEIFVFSLECSNCGYRKADVEPAQKKEPCRYTFEIKGEDDLTVKIIKSGDATIKIPHMITIEPGPASDGFITNIEGLLERVKKIIESSIEGEDDESVKKKGKNMLKKLNNVILRREPLKIILEDTTGNSAIISDKAQKSKL